MGTPFTPWDIALLRFTPWSSLVGWDSRLLGSWSSKAHLTQPRSTSRARIQLFSVGRKLMNCQVKKSGEAASRPALPSVQLFSLNPAKLGTASRAGKGNRRHSHASLVDASTQATGHMRHRLIFHSPTPHSDVLKSDVVVLDEQQQQWRRRQRKTVSGSVKQRSVGKGGSPF